MLAFVLVVAVSLAAGCTVVFSGTAAVVVGVHNAGTSPPPEPRRALVFCSRSPFGTACFCEPAREECEARVNRLRSLGGEFEACKSSAYDLCHPESEPDGPWPWRTVGYAALFGLAIDLALFVSLRSSKLLTPGELH